MANIPPDFTAALKAARLADFFAGCTGPHQNEYLKWINEAKKPETRQKRIAKGGADDQGQTNRRRGAGEEKISKKVVS